MKYLKSKKGSLESSILSVWTEAAKKVDENLVGGQKKLDKDKDGDIDAKDFAMLRKSKKKDNTESFQRYHETKRGSLRDAVLQMWGENVQEYVQSDGVKRRVKEGDNRLKSNKNLTKEKKDGTKNMTDTGKEVTPVDMSPKMPKIKEAKNKV